MAARPPGSEATHIAGQHGEAQLPPELACRQQREPVRRVAGAGEEMRIEEFRALVIGKRRPGQLDHVPAGRLDDRLPGGRIPLRGRPEPGIDLGSAFRQATELQ